MDKPTISETSKVLNDMLYTIDEDLKSLPNDKYYEVKFEDLEQDQRNILNRYINI